jgi:amidase
MREPLHRRPAHELARQIATGDVSSEVVTRSFADAIRDRERTVQAFAWFDEARALGVARELDRLLANDRRRGPLHGLPVAIKDNIDTADLPTGYGSPIYASHTPPADAACVALLQDAGAFVLGKTVCAELANFTPGATRNPHALDHTPGGSSSGSAAAVAAHFAPIALGTQTAGSLIRPAAFCGVIAYKPSPRTAPRAGVKANSDTLDEVGVFANCIDDIALAAAALAVKPAWIDVPQQGRSGAPPVFAATATPYGDRVSRAWHERLDAAVATLGRAGARQAEVTWPRVFDGLFEAQQTVQVYETARALAPEFTYRRDLLSQRLVELIEQGRGIAARDYAAALQLGRACAAAIDSLFGAAGVLLCPPAPGEAPRGLGSTGDPLFCRPWQLLGCPCLTLPIGRGESGLPLGVQIVARPGDDVGLLAAGAWIEQALQAQPGH